jgi:type II secretory pathway component PulK
MALLVVLLGLAQIVLGVAGLHWRTLHTWRTSSPTRSRAQW